MSIRFEDRVAIVTGAGAGLGRSHALGLAARGAKVVVNDLAAADGSNDAADAVVAEIVEAGGEAISNGANVADFEQVQAMVKTTMDTWGRVDILVNNAGILRDKSFVKMPHDDFQAVINVHLNVQLHQGGLGSHACAELRSYRHDNKFQRFVWQLRPDQLWRCEDGGCWFDEYAGY